ncbi:pol protein [Cucumis melo var. makuwa]|uniref:Pol protein n=1 Tax=Cucumis melo var. makuwa TaxID=1194695 RepID=A0A5D3CY16_CUCMM|nr:pol protein [Cucumis melo var. makuwa]
MLTKSTHFILGKFTYTASKWAQLYMTEIVKLHGVLVSIVSDRDSRFTSKFWKGLQATMGTSFQVTIGMTPFEALYGKCCRSLVYWDERIGPVAYRLALPPSLSAVHDVLHVSMLRKYVLNPSHVVDYEPLEIDEISSYVEQPVGILAREVKMLRSKGIPLVKVFWRNHKVEEATWEREDDMKARYPELFEE